MTKMYSESAIGEISGSAHVWVFFYINCIILNKLSIMIEICTHPTILTTEIVVNTSAQKLKKILAETYSSICISVSY